MGELSWVVFPGTAPVPRTGGWRTGVRPDVDVSRCIDCLLCWLHCPDSAVVLDGTAFAGFDYDVCKGCEICSEVCPTDAIEMVAE
ncbi:MAG TPA: 4Fe-4S dicluster-binding protein [Gaiellaceae bacterium]|nr:4Fe-4S dicluster-binding protein [Gaiellaceae bacterium]